MDDLPTPQLPQIPSDMGLPFAWIIISAAVFATGIRVEDPVGLAELVLGGESTGWTAERIEASFGDKQRTVFLPRPLPVHIEYFTEFFDEFGELKERPDVYGLTRKVEGMLARASQD